MDRLKNELSDELDNKAKLEDETQQSEHVSDLVKRLDDIDGDIAEKTAAREALLANIVVQTGDAWKGLVSSRVERILSAIEIQLRELEKKDNEHNVASRFVEEMKAAAEGHHCQVCDQDVEGGKARTASKKDS